MISLFKQYEGVFDKEESEETSDTKDKKYRYSPFALQDAIGGANVKNIWIEYQKLILSGIIPDEIIYNIISKVRDMVFISKGASVSDLGIKDYPYNKSKRDLKNWGINELEVFYEKTLDALFEARQGKVDLGVSIEKILLSLK